MKTRNRLLVALGLLWLASGCARDPSWLVERTIEAREKTLLSKDLDGYVALFHPDYQYEPGQTETIASATGKRFQAHDSIRLRTHNRRITFENNGDIARVNEEYELMAVKNGKTFRASGTEQFLLKRSKSFFGTKYLFYKGLGL